MAIKVKRLPLKPGQGAGSAPGKGKGQEHIDGDIGGSPGAEKG